MLASPRGAALSCFLESQRRWVWGRHLYVGLSLNHSFLPLLQMSESETLISMVNRMVESSSPRAQLFMQVRPLPGSMVLVNIIQLLVHGRVNLFGMGLVLPNPLICQAQPALLPLIPLCRLHFPCSWINPRPISQTIKIASTDISCLPRITNLLCNV